MKPLADLVTTLRRRLCRHASIRVRPVDSLVSTSGAALDVFVELRCDDCGDTRVATVVAKMPPRVAQPCHHTALRFGAATVAEPRDTLPGEGLGVDRQAAVMGVQVTCDACGWKGAGDVPVWVGSKLIRAIVARVAA